MSATRYICGTSNSTALVTRQAALLHDALEILRSEPPGNQIEERFVPILLKALLVHGATWGQTHEQLKAILQDRLTGRNVREYVAKYLGYGRSASSPLSECTAQRATVLGIGELEDGLAHRFSVPLPPSLAGLHGWRRLTATLCWFSTTNSKSNKYKSAALWFATEIGDFVLNRREADARQAQRGTVQHEIFEGDNAVAFEDGEEIRILVNCRAHAGKLTEPVPYALVVSLEVAPSVDIPLYNEIRTRLQVGVPIIASQNP